MVAPFRFTINLPTAIDPYLASDNSKIRLQCTIKPILIWNKVLTTYYKPFIPTILCIYVYVYH